LDCRPFIGFMPDAIGNSLYKYIDVAPETVADVPVNEVSDKILIMLASQSQSDRSEDGARAGCNRQNHQASSQGPP
jgi:hypothetical protein